MVSVAFEWVKQHTQDLAFSEHGQASSVVATWNHGLTATRHTPQGSDAVQESSEELGRTQSVLCPHVAIPVISVSPSASLVHVLEADLTRVDGEDEPIFASIVPRDTGGIGQVFRKHVECFTWSRVEGCVIFPYSASHPTDHDAPTTAVDHSTTSKVVGQSFLTATCRD